MDNNELERKEGGGGFCKKKWSEKHCKSSVELQVLWTNALKIVLLSVTKFMFPPKKKEGLICIYHQVA